MQTVKGPTFSLIGADTVYSSQIPVRIHDAHTWKWLSLSHTTNFRLVQTERVCRRQFQIWWKWQKILQTGRKHCGKRRDCSLRAISPFPTLFSKDLYCRHVKTRACNWNKILISFGANWTLYQSTSFLTFQNLKAFADDKRNVARLMEWVIERKNGKHCGKRRKCWLPAFSPLPPSFFTPLFVGIV